MTDSVRPITRRRLRIAGAAWVLTAIYFVAQAVVQAAWHTPYSLLDNRVSDLGNTVCAATFAGNYVCSPLHALMNATFVLTGLLILVGLFWSRSVWPRRRLTTWGLIMLGIAGAGTVVIGLSPENVNVMFHLVGAINIPAGNAALILLGLSIWRERPRLGPLSVAAGIVGLIGLLAGPVLVILTGHGGGLAERVALYPLIIWLIVRGWTLIAETRRSRAAEGVPGSTEAVHRVRPA